MAPPTSARGMALLALATLRSVLAVLRIRPRVTFATGGYVSVPASVASWLLRVPLVLFLPDVVPGKAVRWLLPLATRIAASSDDSLPYLPAAKTVVTGYPVREPFLHTSRAQGRAHFSLPPDAPVLFVFGGSLGARSINDALARHLPDLLSRAYILHVCGQDRYPEAQEATQDLPPEQRARYRLYPYLHGEEMAAAMAAADLMVSRAGASTLAEAPVMGVPCVLVPFPDPAVHQQDNAAALARRGAAVILDNDTLDATLDPCVTNLLADPARLATMGAAARALARPDAAQRIVALIEGVR